MTETSPTRIVRVHGVPTLEVEGRPFFILGAQCDIWRSTRQDAKTMAFFDGYRDMNATTVSVGVPWSKLEPAPDAYDFAFLDWFIQQAEAHGLKLVANLFNVNICGKVQEGAGPNAYPQYTPSYILDAPNDYQRMDLPTGCRYVDGGPPMCPNDPRTLERERRLVVKVAEHLRQADTRRTVIMLQLDNEFYYQQWDGPRPPDEKAVRCHCRFCEERFAQSPWKDGEEFMFSSFADYAKGLTDAVAEVYDLPLYLNSPWWQPYVIPTFLDRCPNLDLVGIDGVFSTHEPAMLSRSQLGRNIPFAAENPTENPQTRLNLDALPYYTLIGQWGIGNLLWECGPPLTVVEDPVARERYARALYPLKHAMTPIAQARGTDHLVGWYVVRDVAGGVTTDVFGNFIPPQKDAKVAQRERTVIREGLRTRVVEGTSFECTLGGRTIAVEDSAAGIVVERSGREWILAVPTGRVTANLPGSAQAEHGQFDGRRWRPLGPLSLTRAAAAWSLEMADRQVVRVTW